ncbi:hypothetical protein TR75_11010 [Hydrogenibacillus schlegelii]|nr:hypothetical protein TR75_11010 [Hydrogenibacillus schlegelii]
MGAARILFRPPGINVDALLILLKAIDDPALKTERVSIDCFIGGRSLLGMGLLKAIDDPALKTERVSIDCFIGGRSLLGMGWGNDLVSALTAFFLLRQPHFLA